jgi:pilus assembly protein CpaB
MRNLKISKTWVVFAVALGVGLIAAWIARNYLSSQMDAIEARGKGPQVGVVVAKRAMNHHDPLTAESVAVRMVPEEYLQSQALKPEDLKRFEGRRLAVPLKAGEWIVWSMLQGEELPTFSARLAQGRRAITVPVDDINSISGLLEPGDLIDLVVTLDQKGRKVTWPMLQVVRVLATGQRSRDDPRSSEKRQYSTVTLDVSPQEAQQVVAAREAGRLTALLRNPTDHRAFNVGGQDLASFLGLNVAEAELPTGETPQIPVLYGGRGGSFPVEGLSLGRRVRSDTVARPAQPTGVEVPYDDMVSPDKAGGAAAAAVPRGQSAGLAVPLTLPVIAPTATLPRLP